MSELEFLTPVEAGGILRRKYRAVLRLVAREQLRAVKVNNRYLIGKTDLDAFIRNSETIPPTLPPAIPRPVTFPRHNRKAR